MKVVTITFYLRATKIC